MKKQYFKKLAITTLAVVTAFVAIPINTAIANEEAYSNSNIEELKELNFEGVGDVSFWKGMTDDGVEFLVTDGIFIKSGTTECGLEFKAFKPNSNIAPFQIGDSMSINREVLFRGNVRPQATLHWVEFMNGRTWSGILHLTSSFYNAGYTLARYAGTVTAP